MRRCANGSLCAATVDGVEAPARARPTRGPRPRGPSRSGASSPPAHDEAGQRACAPPGPPARTTMSPRRPPFPPPTHRASLAERRRERLGRRQPDPSGLDRRDEVLVDRDPLRPVRAERRGGAAGRRRARRRRDRVEGDRAAVLERGVGEGVGRDERDAVALRRRAQLRLVPRLGVRGQRERDDRRVLRAEPGAVDLDVAPRDDRADGVLVGPQPVVVDVGERVEPARAVGDGRVVAGAVGLVEAARGVDAGHPRPRAPGRPRHELALHDVPRPVADDRLDEVGRASRLGGDGLARRLGRGLLRRRRLVALRLRRGAGQPQRLDPDPPRRAGEVEGRRSHARRT